MTAQDHYRKAEEFTAKAHDYLGQGEDRVPPSGPPSPRFTPLSPSPLLPRSGRRPRTPAPGPRPLALSSQQRPRRSTRA